jgi:hypothetical protein
MIRQFDLGQTMRAVKEKFDEASTTSLPAFFEILMIVNVSKRRRISLLHATGHTGCIANAARRSIVNHPPLVEGVSI